MKKTHIALFAGTLALSIGAAVTVSMLPNNIVQVDAAISTGMIYVGGQDIVAAGSMSGDTGTATYTKTGNKSGKITFDNYTYTGHGYCRDDQSNFTGLWAYVSENDLTIEVKGTNTITAVDDDDQLHMVSGADFWDLDGNITFTGDGTLNLVAQGNPSKVTKYSYGMKATCDLLTFDGPTVNLVATTALYGSFAYYCDYTSNIEVKSGTLRGEGGEVTSSGTSSGMRLDNLKMSGGTVEGVGGKSHDRTYGIIFYGDADKRIFTGGSIKGIGGTSNANKSYGIYTSDENLSLQFGENFESVEAIGNTTAISTEFLVKNALGGNGYEDVEGKGTANQIPAAPEGQHLSASYKNVYLGKFENSYVTAPKAVEGLTFTGEEQELCTAGTPLGGKILYKVGDGEYSEELPKKAEVGTYVVTYKTEGAPNYKDIEEQSFEVSIAEAVSPDDPSNPDNPGKPSRKGIGAGGVVGITLGSIILLIVGAWLLLMFVFNKWIKINDKAVRAFKLFGIKKNGEPLLWAFPFKFVTRKETEIFKSKADALK